MPLTAQISLLPYANEKVAAKVLEHAQDLKESDPKQSIELHEEVIRLLCRQIKQRNKKIRVLKKILLDTLPEGRCLMDRQRFRDGAGLYLGSGFLYEGSDFVGLVE